tara:strand:- start:6726 stop:7676 length:951 start_codon:yes stop_codon:yes gene_type:complete
MEPKGAQRRSAQKGGADLIVPELMARVRQLHLRTHRLVNTALSGGYRSVFRGQGIEFEEVRPYLPGDDVRSIDWNVTARTGAPHVKAYREERELCIHCLVDTGMGMGFGTRRFTKREAAAQLVGLFSFVAIRNQDRIGMTLFGREAGFHLKPAKSSNHILRMIREVVAAPIDTEPGNLMDVLAATNQVLKRRALIFVFSDFDDADTAPWSEPLRRLAAKHDVVGVRIEDPFEAELPQAGVFSATDARGAGWRTIDSDSKSVRDAWRRAAIERRAAFRRAFTRAQAETIEIDTGEDLMGPIGRFFRLRAMRGGRQSS